VAWQSTAGAWAVLALGQTLRQGRAVATAVQALEQDKLRQKLGQCRGYGSAGEDKAGARELPGTARKSRALLGMAEH
jgi:hypothetical protein